MVVSSFTKNLQDNFAFRGQTVTLQRPTTTTDGAGRPVSQSTATTYKVVGYITIITEKEYKEKTWGNASRGDAIGRFKPNEVQLGDIVQSTRDNDVTYKYKVSEKLDSPRDHKAEVVLERFRLCRLDNI